jgi:hypothetical protein
VRVEKEDEIVPERRFVLTLKYVRPLKADTVAGIVPANELDLTASEIKFVSDPREEGRVPAS